MTHAEGDLLYVVSVANTGAVGVTLRSIKVHVAWIEETVIPGEWFKAQLPYLLPSGGHWEAPLVPAVALAEALNKQFGASAKWTIRAVVTDAAGKEHRSKMTTLQGEWKKGAR